MWGVYTAEEGSCDQTMGWGGGIRKVPIFESSLKGSVDFSQGNKGEEGCPRIRTHCGRARGRVVTGQ